MKMSLARPSRGKKCQQLQSVMNSHSAVGVVFNVVVVERHEDDVDDDAQRDDELRERVEHDVGQQLGWEETSFRNGGEDQARMGFTSSPWMSVSR